MTQGNLKLYFLLTKAATISPINIFSLLKSYAQCSWSIGKGVIITIDFVFEGTEKSERYISWKKRASILAQVIVYLITAALSYLPWYYAIDYNDSDLDSSLLKRNLGEKYKSLGIDISYREELEEFYGKISLVFNKIN